MRDIMEEQNIRTPRYLKIAVNLSSRIASGEIVEGQKLKGRSVLSTEYNVSPETIRRAMSILEDKEVVKIVPGRGIIVQSRKNSIQFLDSFKESKNLSDLRHLITKKLTEKNKLDQEINNLVKDIVRLSLEKRSDLIKPVEISIPEDSFVLGKSIGELQIWHNTGATIIGAIQENDIIISPGPYYEFSKDERVLIVGDASVVSRFTAFVNGEE